MDVKVYGTYYDNLWNILHYNIKMYTFKNYDLNDKNLNSSRTINLL
jgi:hypothetical protein